MLSNPIDAFLQAARSKEDNRRYAMEQGMGIGNNIGQGFQNVKQLMDEQRKKQLIMQLSQSMQTQGAPQQGPQLPGMPTTSGAPQPPPTSGMGAPSQDNSSQMMGLMAQIDPSTMISHYLSQQDPYKKALMGLYQAETEKALRPPKPTPEWAPVPGGLTRGSHKTAFYDKFTGAQKEGELEMTPTSSQPGGMGDVRSRQFQMQDLPSRSAPTTAAGAAYQVKVAARQGMALVAAPGSYQRQGLATGDAARAVLRATPTDEAMHNANFSDTMINRVNKLKQQWSADPKAIDSPKMRKEMYDVFKELEASSRPWIENQLKSQEDVWQGMLPPNWEQIKARELGQGMPDIPFQESLLDMGKIKGGGKGGALTPEEQAEFERLDKKFGGKP